MTQQNNGFVYFQSKKDLQANGGLTESQYDFVDEIKRSCAFYFYLSNRRYILTASYANADQTSPEFYISDFQTHKRYSYSSIDAAKDSLIQFVLRN